MASSTKVNRSPLSAREGKVYIDGVLVADSCKFKVVFKPDVWSGKQLSEQGTNRRWIGYDIEVTIEEWKTTRRYRGMIDTYIKNGTTPEMTIQGIGNDLMDCMKTMLRLSVDIAEKHYKKTTLGDFDRENKTLQKYIRVAFRLEILKGLSSYKEWTRRSMEIGKMIGGYINTVNAQESAEGNTANQKPKASGNRNSQYYRKR